MPSISMKQGLFSDPVFNRKLVSLAIPIALQSLMLAAVAAADAIMLGRLNQNSMAAVSLATQIQFVMNMFLSSVVAAGSILGSQYWGKGDLRSLHDIFNLMLRLCFLIDLLFGLFCILVPGTMMTIFTNDPTLNEIGASYLRIAGWSYLLTGISQCYLTIMKLSGHAGRTAFISSSAVILNIILNSILIFGLIGLPEMGAEGAAIATLISRIVELIWASGSSLQKGFIRPDLTRLFQRNRLLSHDFRKICLPLLGASLLWGIGFTSYSAIMGHLGQDAAAANSVAAVVRDLACCMCNGISNAGSILLGSQLGQGHLDRAKIYGDKLMKISFLVGFMTTGVVLLFIHPVLLFYRLTPDARALCTGMLVITSFYMVGRCVNTVVINGIFDAGGDTKFDVFSLLVVMWMIAIPTALSGAFLFHWPVLLVYACTCLDEVGKTPWVIHHFHKYHWLRNLTR